MSETKNPRMYVRDVLAPREARNLVPVKGDAVHVDLGGGRFMEILTTPGGVMVRTSEPFLVVVPRCANEALVLYRPQNYEGGMT